MNSYTNTPLADATKLQEANISPTVALTRGYQYLPDETHIPTLNLDPKQARQLARDMDGNGALIMPWQPPDRTGKTLQYRPDQPRTPRGGKPIKYATFKGQKTIIDIHPAIPDTWIYHPGKIIFCEGLIKADSTLTAYLKHLNLNDTDPTNLKSALIDIPEKDRILICAIAGVVNWATSPEIREIGLHGKETWICFDADIETNQQVATQAHKFRTLLEKRKATPIRLLKIPAFTDPNTGETITKAGVDDYLAAGHDWHDLTQLVTDFPPPPTINPTDEDPQIGEVRLTDDGHQIEKFTKIGPDMYDWAPTINYGATIVSNRTIRPITVKELAEGKQDSTVWGGREEIQIQVKWRDNTGATRIGHVTGPTEMLEAPISAWGRSYGAKIDSQILMQLEWPPNPARDFLAVLKTGDEVEEEIVYPTMGWQPDIETGQMVFRIGCQQISTEGVTYFDPSRTGWNRLPEHASFELPDLGKPGSKTWKKKAIQAVKETLGMYLGRPGELWLDTATGLSYPTGGSPFNPGQVGGPARQVAESLVLLGTALRPTLPVRPGLSVMLVGAPSSGKSWTAGRIMKFWGDSWGTRHLPGSALDTKPAIEWCLSKTPIWVLDDLAPSVSARVAENAENVVADMIRATFNQQSRNKMGMGLDKGGMVAAPPPAATLVVTSERPLSTDSAAGRCIQVEFTKGDTLSDEWYPDLGGLSPVEWVERVEKDRPPARLTAVMIGYLLCLGHDLGWPELTRRLMADSDRARKFVAGLLKSHGKSIRLSQIGAEILLPLGVLGGMVGWLGLDTDEYFSGLFPPGTDSDNEAGICRFKWARPVEGLLAANQIKQQEDSSARDLLIQLAGMLARGRAHVRALVGDAPPFNDPQVDSLLGWSGQETPRSDIVGTGVVDPETGQRIVLFNSTAAFQVVRKDLRVHGTPARTLWQGLWEQGMCYRPWARFRTQAGKSGVIKYQNFLRPDGGRTSLGGVPVPLDLLLAAGFDDAGESDE